MSSILRALKKLESDSRHLAENRALDTKFVPLADTGSRRPAFSLITMVGAGLVCGIVVLGGWYLFSAFNRPVEPEPGPASSRDVAPAVPAVMVQPPAPVAENDRGGESTESAPPRVQQLPAEIVSEKQGKPVTAEPVPMPEAVREAPAAENVPAVEQLQAEEQPATETAPPPAAMEKIPVPADETTGAAAAGAESVPEKTAPPEIPKLDDPEMVLQAITWSRTPEKRIAVINSRIIREGDVVGGYSVNSINPDDVVLDRNGEKWRLLFRIR